MLFAIDLIQIVVFVVLLVALAKPIGTFFYKVFSGERTFLHRDLPARGR